jgi:methylated-DNA-[protein]-cysteine S-methyltransferase
MTRSSHKQPIHIDQCVISSPFGSLRISTELVDGSLMISEISYLAKGLSKVRPQNDLARQAKDQIEAYFEDPLFKFNLPLKQQGTPYQHRVWSAISDIPVGNTISYGDLAQQIKSGPRAVGGACGANYYPLLIPCHRVLSANGLGGFMQQGGEIGRHLDIKRWLLRHEGIEFIKP